MGDSQTPHEQAPILRDPQDWTVEEFIAVFGAPKEDGERWRVDHPGIGVLDYETEAEARAAAGTAGALIPPGGGDR